MNTNYTGTPGPTNPAAEQGLYPNWLTNSIQSLYAAEFGYTSTMQLQAEIQRAIVDSIPAKYAAIKLLYDKPPVVKNDEEFFWYERDIPRPILEVAVQAGAANPQTVTLTAGGAANVSMNTSVVLPNERTAIVTAVDTNANTITIKALNGEPNLPQLEVEDNIIIGFPVVADGQNFFSDYSRMKLDRFSNYIGRGMRAKRWTRMTAQKYQNNQTVDYFEKDAAELMEHVYNDMFYMFFNSHKGEFDVNVPAGTGLTGGTYKAKVPDGIFPYLQKNGVAYATSSAATLEADFATLAFATDYKNIDQPRFVLGTPEMLYQMSKVWKDPVQYKASDTINSLDLELYRFGQMKYVPVPITHFEGRFNQFGSSWKDRLMVLDLDKINPCIVKGFSQIEAGNTGHLSRYAPGGGGYNDYIDYFVEYMLGTQVETVKGHFYIDFLH